jgi:hypothetical protein
VIFITSSSRHSTAIIIVGSGSHLATQIHGIEQIQGRVVAWRRTGTLYHSSRRNAESVVVVYDAVGGERGVGGNVAAGPPGWVELFGQGAGR